MSSSAILMSSILTRPWGDMVSSVDCDVVTGALFALYIQHAWNSYEKSSAPLSDEYSAPCSQQIESAKADEEVCDFARVSAGLGKPPVYDTAKDIEQTLEVLHVESVPEWQTGLFLGVGLVSPICTTLDMSTRKVRRAGKSVLQKKNLKRERLASDTAYNDRRLYERRSNESREDGEVFSARRDSIDKSSAMMPKTFDGPLERVMQPVSFSQVEST